MTNQKDRQGMARFGINVDKAFGISVYKLRAMAKNIPTSHKLADELWKSGYHEARILAIFVDEEDKVTDSQMESWVKDFDSWDICDQCCSNLFDKTVFAYPKAIEWSERRQEFVKRAGFVLMAVLAVHDNPLMTTNLHSFSRLSKEKPRMSEILLKKRSIGPCDKSANATVL